MIESLRLQNFRCFEEASLRLDGDGRFFVGSNAQGKTSLLEAVCVLLRLQSPRTRQTNHLIREGSEGFGIAGEAWERDLQLRGDRKEMIYRVDGVEVDSRRDYLEASGLVVWMGNEDLDLIRGGGESRRRFLDFMATQVSPDYRYHWSRYRQALKARNRYLKDYAPGNQVVTAYTQLLLEHGREMIGVREELCEALTPRVSENQAAMSGDKDELVLSYQDRSKGDLEAAFAEVEESESRRGITLAGPHRDDLKLILGGRSAKDFGSEGQQRTIALALKLAQGELLRRLGNQEPVYLIDDVFGELDPERRNALIALLPSNSQKLITTTHLDWLAGGTLDLPVSKVQDGRVSEG